MRSSLHGQRPSYVCEDVRLCPTTQVGCRYYRIRLMFSLIASELRQTTSLWMIVYAPTAAQIDVSALTHPSCDVHQTRVLMNGAYALLPHRLTVWINAPELRLLSYIPARLCVVAKFKVLESINVGQNLLVLLQCHLQSLIGLKCI